MPSTISTNYREILDTPVELSPQQVRKIAIIGGGASGAIALDSLVQESDALSITLFERRDALGGVWKLDPETIKTPNHIVKSGSTHLETDPQLENPFHSETGGQRFVVMPRNTQERFEETPSYLNLKTNIIESMMTFSDAKSWNGPGTSDPEETVYVDGLIVQKYIKEYVERHSENENVSVVFNTTVEDVERVPRNALDSSDIPYRFRLTLRQALNSDSDIWYQEIFDSIVVTVGHYHVPFIPHVDGLKEVQEKFPGVVEHAKFYRTPEVYAGLNSVVVVGSRALGADLTKLLADQVKTVYQSIRNNSLGMKLSKKPNILLKPVISRYEVVDEKNFKAVFEDGLEIVNPDRVIYGTGYQFSFPFLNRLFESESAQLTNEGLVIPNLYQHTFLVNEPLINFVGVPVDGISFRVFEYQAVLVARFLAGKVALPTRFEQNQWIVNRFKEKGLHRAYHTIGIADAQSYLAGLVALGEPKNGKPVSGRPFPLLTEDDMARIRAAGIKLREFWDER